MRDSQWTRLGEKVVLAFVLGGAMLSGGCSLRSMAVNAIVPTLANPDVYRSEEDPELVRDSLPFLRKTIESILDTSPEQEEALIFACTGFTLYGNAFLQVDADLAEWDDYGRALELGPDLATLRQGAGLLPAKSGIEVRRDHRAAAAGPGGRGGRY